MPNTNRESQGTFCVVLAQLTPEPRAIEANLARMQDVLLSCAEADLVIFPELWLGGYTTTKADALAIAIDDARLTALKTTAKNRATAVIFGAAVRQDSGIANAAVVIDSKGQWLDHYAKLCLFGDEPEAYTPGEELLVVDIDGLKTGLMICFDLEFPEIARALAQAGAELLVTISANMTPFGPDHRVFGVARAIENGCAHVYVNQTGHNEQFKFTGQSMTVSPDGELLADAGGQTETVTAACLKRPARSNERPDYLRLVPARPLPVRGA